MVMTNATEAYPLSDAERKDREALLKRLGVNFAPAIAEIIPLDHEVRKRRPLGLKPILDDDAPSALPATWTPQPGVPAMRDDLAMAMDVIRDIAEALVETQDRAKAKFDEVQAQFANQIAALKNENQSLRIILENLRITQRGDRGIRQPISEAISTFLARSVCTAGPGAASAVAALSPGLARPTGRWRSAAAGLARAVSPRAFRRR